MKGSASKTEITRRDPAMVLIAESDETARTLYVESILFFTNYRVVEATNGPDALEKIRRHRPTVAVLSMALTDFEGWTAIRTLKRDPATRDVCIVVVSTHDDSSDREVAEEAAVDELLGRPLLAQELIDTVKRCAATVASSRPRSARRTASDDPRGRPVRSSAREPRA